MKLEEMLSKATKASKKDDIPGTVDAILDETCPACGRKLKQYKPCCGSPKGYRGCSCGYKINDF